MTQPVHLVRSGVQVLPALWQELLVVLVVLLHVPQLLVRELASHSAPVDPALAVVAAADIDVLGERNHRNVDVTGIFGERAELVDEALAAVRNAAILPSDAIDPVLSSAIATRMRTLPQAAVELVVKPRFG